MFLLGLLRALVSRAQTPTTPIEGFRRSSLPFLAEFYVAFASDYVIVWLAEALFAVLWYPLVNDVRIEETWTDVATIRMSLVR